MSNQLELCVSSAVVEGVRVSMERYVLEVVEALSREYNFSASDASSKLGLVGVKVSVTDGSVGRKRKVVAKECVEKSAFPLPFMGRNVEECCQSLRQSQGLYTQCRNSKAGEKFCKSCSSKMVDGVPEYGTIEQRLAVGVNDYVDPSGRKVVHYTKIMKKYKVSEEQVIAEAKKLGQVVDGCHFIQPESDNVKRGRPKAEKPAKVSSGVKGRPKKTKKVVEIDGEEDDLFASLVAESINASAAVEVETVNAEAVADVEAEAKAPEVATKEKTNKSEEKAAKLATKEQEKAAKLAAKEQEKAAKLAAKEQEKAAKEQEKAAKEQEKAAKLAAKSEAKSKKPAEKPAAPANDDTSAADVVKKIEFEGKKYLKSKKTGIVYDYDEYVKSGDQVVVGKWNEATNKLDFETAKSDGEESEDEYDEE
jgi:chemotaxis protein histidine kinase CheA